MPDQPQYPVVYLFDADGYATGETGDVTPGDVPGSYSYSGRATTVPPPDLSGTAGMAARWNGMAWEIVPAPTPADKRASAYRLEADPLLATHQQYQAEAEAWKALEGTEAYDGEQAERAKANASEALAAYLAKKREIRERFPDAE
jgi:hypothetical protein